MSEQHNTKVYVENLPSDITEQEFIDVMAKYGLIFRDPSSGKFKVKLYSDADGQLKGDGICTYIKVSFYFYIFFCEWWGDFYFKFIISVNSLATLICYKILYKNYLLILASVTLSDF